MLNNKDLRTVANRILARDAARAACKHDISTFPTERDVFFATGIVRLLDENKRLSDLLVDEILDGSVEVPSTDMTVRAADLPDGFQEVELDDDIV